MGEPNWFPVSIEPEALAHYVHGLGHAGHREGLLALARAIAASPGWGEMAPGSVLVVRPTPTPVPTRPSLAVLGQWDDEALAWFQGQGQELSPACGHLCYLGDRGVREAAILLAAKLREQFADQELARARFTAIPRGGFIVLGHLAIALGLRGEQLEPSPKPSDSLLIVVDDCSLTGARFGEFARRAEFPRLVFAHLYSHPELRQAIVNQEPRVEAVVAAHDLEERLSELPEGWRQKRLDQLGGGRYWIGLSETLCFPWNEPDRLIWNAARAKTQTAWHIVPPELCLKNRRLKNRPADDPTVPVRILEEGPGPLVAAPDVLWGELEDQLVIGDMKAGVSFALTGVAADMWRSLLRGGGINPALADLTTRYSVEPLTLEQDLKAFTGQLTDAGLIITRSISSTDSRGSVAPSSSWKTHRIFGRTLASDFPFNNRLEAAKSVKSAGEADLTFSCSPTQADPTQAGPNKAELELLYTSPYRISKTTSVCDLYRGDDYDLLRFSGVGDFHLRGDRIECHRTESVPDELIEIRFLGAVLGFWLERRGIPALHGSAVDIDGRLAVFLSSNRGGKTGLAATLVAAGHALVTDDLLPVGESDGGESFLGHGGYPQMRMWPDEAEHFLALGQVGLDRVALDRIALDRDMGHVHPTYSKRRIYVGPGGLGRFDGGSRPLGCFYLPERRETLGDLVTITPLTIEEAIEALTELSFSPRLVLAAGLEAPRRAFFRRVLEQVPVRRLVYRSGFEWLPRVAAEVERDMVERDMVRA